MPKFIFAYHGGKYPEGDAESRAAIAAWDGWAESNAGSFADPGGPVGKSKTVSATGVTDDGGSNPLGGYSIVEMADVQGAIALAQSCPHLKYGGSVEIAEVGVMA